MPVDVARLQTMSTFTDDSNGIIERFVDVPLESGSTVGVLSLPVAAHGTTGWVITHSFGPEQPNLNALDVAIARRIASLGSPVLRFHCQGYGDSELEAFTASIASHVQDTVDATRSLRTLTDVRSVGLIGTRFGGSCALLVGSSIPADHVVMIAPSVRGSRFLRELVRSGAIIELTKAKEDGVPDAWSVLKKGGSISVRGSVITGDHYRSFDELDLRKTPPFSGTALLVQVSTGTQPRRDIAELSAHLENGGAAVTTAVVSDRAAALLGERHFRPTVGDLLGDVALELHPKIADVVADWCAALPAVGSEQEERSAR